MLLPSQTIIDSKRTTTYRNRAVFLGVSAALILAAHLVDRAHAGGPAPAALALRLAWCVLLALTAWALLRGGPRAIGIIRVVAPLGSVFIYLVLTQVTGGASSPLLPFACVLVVLLPILTYDVLPMGWLSGSVALAGSWVIIWRGGLRGAELWGWVHIGAAAFALGCVLGWAFGRALAERQRTLEELQQALAGNQQLVGELRTALGNVRTLRGLLPICAFCKKIRNDDGYWEQLEQYVSAHSDAVFSHSFCPECAAEQYPEHVER